METFRDVEISLSAILQPKNPMKLHWLQHVPFEGLGCIEPWAKARGADISCTRLFENEELPDISGVRLLVVVGGPMGVCDHDQYPWLVREKQLVRRAIDAGKTVLGICLGAQIIADVLGAEVYPGLREEIGWFPVQRLADAPEWIPEKLTVFHWHRDTFALPVGAVRLASSAVCENQGFIWNGRIVGLQFHMETTEQSVNALIEHCGHELVEASGIQSAKKMRGGMHHLAPANRAMSRLIEILCAQGSTLESPA